MTIEERVVAVALADQLGTALALAGPAERERLAKESASGVARGPRRRRRRRAMLTPVVAEVSGERCSKS